MLAPRIHYPVNSAAQGLSRHLVYIFAVLCPQIVHQEGIHSLFPIPFRQIIKVVPDGMPLSVICQFRHGIHHIQLGKFSIAFHIGTHLHVVNIPPRSCPVSPGSGAVQFDKSAHFVLVDSL